MTQEKKQHTADTSDEEQVEPKAGTEIDEDAVDDILDEIDDVLEENAEEFVSQFVQKGGQ